MKYKLYRWTKENCPNRDVVLPTDDDRERLKKNMHDSDYVTNIIGCYRDCYKMSHEDFKTAFHTEYHDNTMKGMVFNSGTMFSTQQPQKEWSEEADYMNSERLRVRKPKSFRYWLIRYENDDVEIVDLHKIGKLIKAGIVVNASIKSDGTNPAMGAMFHIDVIPPEIYTIVNG